MAGQAGAVFVEGPQVIVGQPAERPEGDVKRPGGVPLGEDELVVRAHHVVMQAEENVQRRQIATDVTDTGFVVHLEQS